MGLESVNFGASLMLQLTVLLLTMHFFGGIDAYSKYGRGCADIGCLPNEECVITSDSCSYNQHDGKDCGNYPTCKRKSGSSSSGTTQSFPSVNPSGSSLSTGPEKHIFAPASSNPTLNTYTYFNHNNQQQHHHHQQNGGSGSHNANINEGGIGLSGGNADGSSSGGGVGNGGGSVAASAAAAGVRLSGGSSAGGIDPHYVFGAKHNMPVMSNMPIFPYNSPTQAPSFQQFPQPNHPGSVLNPGYPMHGLQPVNPYNPPFVFGQQPFYSGPGGTGGPPGGSAGILGGNGGGLAPYGSNYGGYQNPNMYNKPPPQYQNQNQQNPYNRQTQARPSSSACRIPCNIWSVLVLVYGLLLHQRSIST